MAGPSPGNGALETYLVNQVGRCIPTVSEAQGSKPGQPVRTAGVGEAVLEARGKLRQDADTDPTLEVGIQLYGHAPAVARRISTADIDRIIAGQFGRGGGSVANLIGAVRNVGLTPQIEFGNPAPRWGIKRSNYTESPDDADWCGQAEDFYSMGTDWDVFFKPPGGAGSTGNWKAADLPKLVVDEENNVLYLLLLSHYTSDDKYDVIVYRYDPATDTQWTFVADLPGHDLADTVDRSELVPFGIAGCFFRGVLHIFVGGYDGTDAPLYTMRVSGSDVVLNSTNQNLREALIGYTSTFNGLAVAANDGGFLLAISGLAYLVTGDDPTRVVQVAWSPDGVQWTIDPENPRAIDWTTLGEFNFVQGSVGAVTSVHFSGASVGWAVTTAGEIFKTTDGGRSWVGQVSPVSADRAPLLQIYRPLLYCVRACSTDVAYACGEAGLLLKTSDGGATWKIKRLAADRSLVDANDLDLASDDDATRRFRRLTAMAWHSATTGWVVGEGGLVLYTDDGAASFTVVKDWSTDANLAGVTIEDIGTNSILIAGHRGVFNNASIVSDASKRGATVARLTSANTDSPTITYHRPINDDIQALQKYSGGATYALTVNGYLLKRSTGDVWTRIRFKAPGWKSTPKWMNFDCLRVLSSTCVLIFGRQIWRTIDSGDNWIVIDKPTRTDGSGWFFDEDTGVAGGQGGIAFALNIGDDRLYCDVLALPDGNRFLVSLANKTKGLVEAYDVLPRRDGSMEIGRVLGDEADSAIKLTFPAFEAADGLLYAPQTSLALDEYGQIMLMAGIGRGDYGRAVPTAPGVSSTSGSLPAGDYLFAITTRDTTTLLETFPSAVQSLTLGAPGGGALTFSAAGSGRETRIYRTEAGKATLLYLATVNSAATSYTDDGSDTLSAIGVPGENDGGLISRDGRDWQSRNLPTHSFPLGKFSTAAEQASGIQNLANTRYSKAYFGRIFSIALYQGRSVATKVLTFAARQFDESASPSHFPIALGKPQYSGVDKMTVSILGDARPGDEWSIATEADFPASLLTEESPSAVFRSKDNASDLVILWDRQSDDAQRALGPGSHFVLTRWAMFNTWFKDAILDVSIPSWNSGTFPTDPTQYVRFLLSSVVDTFDAVSSIVGVGNLILLAAADRDLVPDHYKATRGRRYYLYSDFFGSTFAIEGNTRDSIIIERLAYEAILGRVLVFGNRFFSKLDNGTCGSTSNIILMNENYKHTRLVRLTVPKAGSGQGIYGDHRQIGTPIGGPAVGPTGLSRYPYENRHGYSAGYGWQRSASSVEEGGPAGVSAVRNFGTLGRWSLPYNAIQWFDRDMQQNAFGDDIRQAFCFVPDTDRPDTAELVRMREGEVQTILPGGRVSYGYDLVQVP